MKTLILKEKNWRCGGYGELSNRRGEGNTALRNKEGYMCCLGQFAKQLNPKIHMGDLENRSSPQSVCKPIPLLINENGNTPLSEKAMIINDDEETTVTKKVAALRKLFKKHGYEIKFIKNENQ